MAALFMETDKLIKILIVSDDAFLFLLRKVGYRCSFVQDEHQALSILESNSFDVLILGWPINGEGLLEITSKLHKIGVILISILPESGLVVPNFVDKIIIRPYGIKDLLDAVKEVLR